MVVLVDDRDGARMQVDPEEVGPHLHAALQLVTLLKSRQPAVDRIHAHRACWCVEMSWLDQQDKRRLKSVPVCFTRVLRLGQVQVCLGQGLLTLKIIKTLILATEDARLP